MADRIQQRRDTAANWAKYNPVLLEGEVGYVLDNPNQYKIGDGEHPWNDLPFRGYTGTISQELGDDENAVMSQKTVTYVTNSIDRVLNGASRFALEYKLGDEITLVLKTSTYLNKYGAEIIGIDAFTVGEYSLTENDRNTDSYLVCDFIFAGEVAIAVAYYDSDDNFIGTHDFTGLLSKDQYKVKTILRTDEKVAKIKLCAYQSSPKLYRMRPNDGMDYLRAAFGNDIFPEIVEPDSIEKNKQISADGTIIDNQNISVGLFNDLSNIDKIAVYSYTNSGIINIAFYDEGDNLLSKATGNSSTSYQYVLLQKPKLATKARVCWVDGTVGYMHTIFVAKQMNGYEKAMQLNLDKAPITHIWRDGGLTDIDIKAISAIINCDVEIVESHVSDRINIAALAWDSTGHYTTKAMVLWLFNLDSDEVNSDGDFIARMSIPYESEDELGIKHYFVETDKIKVNLCVDFLKLKNLFPDKPSIYWDSRNNLLFVKTSVLGTIKTDNLGNNTDNVISQYGITTNAFDYVDNINRVLLSSKIGTEIEDLTVEMGFYLGKDGEKLSVESSYFYVAEYTYTESDRNNKEVLVCDLLFNDNRAIPIAYYDADDNFLFKHPIDTNGEGAANAFNVKMILHKYGEIAKVRLCGYSKPPKLYRIPLYDTKDYNIDKVKGIIGNYPSINDYVDIGDKLTIVDNHYLDLSGTPHELNSFAYTDYYSAKDIVSLRVDTRIGEALGIIFWYNEVYNIIDSVAPGYKEGVVKSFYSDKPKDAVYFRVSYYKEPAGGNGVYASYKQKDLITFIESNQDNVIKDLKRIIFIPIYGQSLSVGGESSPAISTVQKYNSLMFNTGTVSKPDSPDEVASFKPLINSYLETSAPGTGEMFIEALMRENALYAYSTEWDNVQLLFVCPGQGSSNIEYLSNDGEGGHYNYFKNCLQAAKNICDANGYTIEVPAWCWIQGETDLNQGNTKVAYYEALLSLQNKINSDVKSIIGQTKDVKCICYQTGCQCLYTQDYGFDNDEMNVLTAQMEAVRDNEAFMASVPMYMMDHVIGSNIHLTNISEKLLGAYQGYALKRYLIDGELNKGVCPLSCTVSGNDIFVKYSVPCPPLEFDTNYVRETKNMGYTCIKSDNSDIAESVSLYNDTVTIHCSENPTGCKLRYALNGESIVIPPSSKTGNSGREYGGRGNLRDSQGYHVYKDIEGIKYPLHNWAYAFERMV